ncbi:DUF4959 domain-containing protein [Plebeiibacterium sediminum]|uniref:DUF4959 domain-containing protein n=1 Tax=Plebeiibacterium sediminum TaxID=2992112 RepID=A0AAE3M4S6_9BACT|nr:DUF4959 domain-containing protein [Plebeiobacterium sediminum]MCW3786815.1 DUF4959 domain-containing protein [Plebeiobacterium sediminum]
MKKLIILLLVIAGFYACDKDDAGGLNVPTNPDSISFEPIEGGAIMRYSISDNRVYRIKAQYSDQYGNSVVKLASFANDSLLLTGFNAPQENVGVEVSYLDENDNESDAMSLTFNTKASAVYSFFDGVEVDSFWDGFVVRYTAPEYVSGFANVYFLGTNPLTNEEDSILLETFPIKAGGETRFYSLDESQKSDYNTVFITTEDYKQEVARTQSWESVEAYSRILVDNSEFSLIDPFNLSIEEKTDNNPAVRWGKEYLFDGDIKGNQRLQNFVLGNVPPQYTFIAGPRAMQNLDDDQMYFVLDINEANVVGEIRLYSMLDHSRMASPSLYNYKYHTRTPCKVTIYACNDYIETNDPKVESGSWKEVGSFDRDPNEAQADRWYIVQETGYYYDIQSIADMNAADPAYMSIPIEFDGNTYRYFKIAVEDTYNDEWSPDYYNNNDGYVSFHEIEVYAKKN